MARVSLREQLRRATRRYRKHRTGEHLRWLLNAKARLGIWDSRFCEYYHVPPHVNKATRHFIMRGYLAGLVPTATTNGDHARGSYHYKHQAADMGSRTGGDRARKERFQLREFHAWQRGKRGNMIELIGPNDYACVLASRHTPVAHGSDLERAHENHTHGAFR